MCTVLQPPGGYAIAVNKYNISYHIKETFTDNISKGITETSGNKLDSFHFANTKSRQ
jgi:hypothetical protein